MALLLLGCAGAPWPTLAPDRSVALQARAAAAMGLTFPPDTRFLVLRRASDGPSLLPRLDDSTHLNIALPSASAARFLAVRPFSEARWDVGTRWVHDEPNWPDWRPSREQPFRSAQIALPKGEFLDVLGDQDGLEPVIVYQVWFET
jgi:hypothetical protein